MHKTLHQDKRWVIIHRHLFKNAGTTFDGILENNFGESFCEHHEDVPMRKTGSGYLIQYLTDHPQIKALSSHHIWFNMPEHHSLELIPVLFLRHPIERMRSVYDFEKKQAADTPGARMAKRSGFKDYISWYMQDNAPATIRNFHTRHIAGIKNVAPLKKWHFKRAVDELRKQPFIGVVDMFDQSLENFQKAFSLKGIQLDLAYESKNINRPFENADYESRAREVLEKLGDVAALVLEKNAFDLKLYKMARERIKLQSHENS